MRNWLNALFGGAATPSQKTLELEAKLSPLSGSGRGEVEYAEYADGGRSLEVELFVQPGDYDLHIDGRVSRRLSAPQGRVDLKSSTRQGEDVPTCRAGERVEIRQGGAPVLAGAFTPD